MTTEAVPQREARAGQANEFGPPSPDRRRFLSRLSLVLSGLIGAIIGVPVVGFLLAPLLREAPSRWYAVGAVSLYPLGETVEVVIEDPSPLPWAGLASRTAVWLRRTDFE